MKGLRTVGGILRAVFLPQPGIPTRPRSRNIKEAIERLNHETASLVSEMHDAAPARSIDEALIQMMTGKPHA